MNNRQAGRRRGRGGQRPQGGNPNRSDNGNRIDNRARGNAAQLLEKYKNLARDAQMQGDRVNIEYYLQFADHYFRVLSESRSRFEENNNRRPQSDEDDDDFEMEGEPGTPDQFDRSFDRRPERDSQRSERGNDRGDNRDQGRGDREPREARGERRERPERAERQERPDRQDRPERDDRRRERGGYTPAAQVDGNAVEERQDAPAPVAADAATEEAPRRRGRPRRQPELTAPEASASEGTTAIEADRLPPSLGLVATADDEEAPKPRRRRKRVDDEEATPSAA
ncbi:DUF4167 domain-containing protein [Sphingomonas sp. Y38-1Y]|uniref:DUF4167 domain-containing protein n=1 Tax=Sphingomonas sp. Y38-1Y TaxID=3078265 RepID=UPI0028E4012F|nr:DUF4167 domain-containing protein [Sphingomonas sp. Y38-1Y]